MSTDADGEGEAKGRRERKREETRARIIAAGMRLFHAHGYAGTTLDAIAAEAGISRRSFFHHFRSKDDILLSLHTGMGAVVVAGLAGRRPDQRPIEAVRDAVIAVIAGYPLEEMIAIDRLMRSSETVLRLKQARYLEDEAVLFAALCRHWPGEDETGLRIVAAISIALIRLSVDGWSGEGGRRPLADVLGENFATAMRMLGP